MFQWFKAIATVSTVAFLAACGGSDDPPSATQPTQNIVQLAQAQNLNALVAAATKAGLAGTLSDASANLTVTATVARLARDEAPARS